MKITSSSTNPGTYLGGTWILITDRFIVGAGSSYSVNATGGASTVALSGTNNGPHSHGISLIGYTEGSSNMRYTMGWGYTRSGTLLTTDASGSGTPHENRPPYIAKYLWLRTA